MPASFIALIIFSRRSAGVRLLGPLFGDIFFFGFPRLILQIQRLICVCRRSRKEYVKNHDALQIRSGLMSRNGLTGAFAFPDVGRAGPGLWGAAPGFAPKPSATVMGARSWWRMARWATSLFTDIAASLVSCRPSILLARPEA